MARTLLYAAVAAAAAASVSAQEIPPKPEGGGFLGNTATIGGDDSIAVGDTMVEKCLVMAGTDPVEMEMPDYCCDQIQKDAMVVIGSGGATSVATDQSCNVCSAVYGVVLPGAEAKMPNLAGIAAAFSTGCEDFVVVDAVETTNGCVCATDWDYNGVAQTGCIMEASYDEFPWCYTADDCGTPSAYGSYDSCPPLPDTLNGCTCATDWTYGGTTYNGCTMENSYDEFPWCYTEGECGTPDNYGNSYDSCPIPPSKLETFTDTAGNTCADWATPRLFPSGTSCDPAGGLFTTCNEAQTDAGCEAGGGVLGGTSASGGFLGNTATTGTFYSAAHMAEVVANCPYSCLDQATQDEALGIMEGDCGQGLLELMTSPLCSGPAGLNVCGLCFDPVDPFRCADKMQAVYDTCKLLEDCVAGDDCYTPAYHRALRNLKNTYSPWGSMLAAQVFGGPGCGAAMTGDPAVIDVTDLSCASAGKCFDDRNGLQCARQIVDFYLGTQITQAAEQLLWNFVAKTTSAAVNGIGAAPFMQGETTQDCMCIEEDWTYGGEGPYNGCSHAAPEMNEGAGTGYWCFTADGCGFNEYEQTYGGGSFDYCPTPQQDSTGDGEDDKPSKKEKKAQKMVQEAFERVPESCYETLGELASKCTKSIKKKATQECLAALVGDKLKTVAKNIKKDGAKGACKFLAKEVLPMVEPLMALAFPVAMSPCDGLAGKKLKKCLKAAVVDVVEVPCDGLKGKKLKKCLKSAVVDPCDGLKGKKLKKCLKAAVVDVGNKSKNKSKKKSTKDPVVGLEPDGGGTQDESDETGIKHCVSTKKEDPVDCASVKEEDDCNGASWREVQTSGHRAGGECWWDDGECMQSDYDCNEIEDSCDCHDTGICQWDQFYNPDNGGYDLNDGLCMDFDPNQVK